MDRVKRTIDVVKALNKFNKDELSYAEFVKEVCTFFDFIKDLPLSEADISFLIYLANKTGVPHYFDMLRDYNENVDLTISEEKVGINTISALIYENSLYTDEFSKLHRFQKEILNKYKKEKTNRYFISASTSFGKTHLAYEVIKKQGYKNIILIFPTIALLSENLLKLKERKNYEYFKNHYSIHTLSEGKEEYSKQNIFIFTPERFLSFLDKNEEKIEIDFVFIDEVYKIDNQYVEADEEEIKEHDRDLAYRMAIFYILKRFEKIDVLLAGPYITFSNESTNTYNPSFDLFLKAYNITLINKNEYEIVNKSITTLSSKKIQLVDDNFMNFFVDDRVVTSKSDKLKIVLTTIMGYERERDRNTIIYCATKPSVEGYAKSISNWNISGDFDNEIFQNFTNHLQKVYHNEWCVIKALKKNIGIHHGVVPKYIQKEIVNLFNSNGGIKILVCTTTITEGVNTSAKNLIALSDTKGIKPLKSFDAKNIAGRAGRFMEHYKGVVISIGNKFESILFAEEEGIKHKNFDVNAAKDSLDIEMTMIDYLNPIEKLKRDKVKQHQEELKIPEDILKQFKAISREDKMTIYVRITELNSEDLNAIKDLIQKVQTNRIDFKGFDVFINTIKPIVRDKNFIFLLKRASWKDEKGQEVTKEYPRISYSLYFYLKGGFQELFNYRYNILKESVDEAMRRASELIFNTFKYNLVKYLGVFNLMYKYHQSKIEGKNFDEILALDKLLSKLEYNAYTEKGKVASDYGVPQKIIDYYDSESEFRKNRILRSFDNYEKEIFEKIKTIFD